MLGSTPDAFWFAKNRRSQTEILADIISVAKNGEAPFKIMEETGLNSERVKLYLQELCRLGLIETDRQNGRRVCAASQRGIQYLKQYEELRNLLK